MKARLRLPNPMVAVVWLAFLLPGRLAGDGTDAALAAAVCAVAAVMLWTKPAPWESREPARRAAALFGALQVLFVFSYLYALAFKGALTGPQDYYWLPRWLFLGVFVVYLVRHYDAAVFAATEAAAVAALYGCALFFGSPTERTYYAALALCYLLLFSRSALRYLHAAAAVIALIFTGARPSWGASADLLRHIRRSLALGWGPARYELVSGSGSQYALWLARGGVLGLGLILAGAALVASRLLRDEDDLRRRAAVAAFLACVAGLLLSCACLDANRMFFVTAFLLAGVHRAGRSAE